MPWTEVTVMTQREEFVRLARTEGANISRKTGYKWLARVRAGPAGRQIEWSRDRSRRPRRSPLQTPPRRRTRRRRKINNRIKIRNPNIEIRNKF